jgi:hypothetical protein
MKAYLCFTCDPYLDITDTKDPKDYRDFREVEISPEDYIVYKGLLIQFDRLQEKLWAKKEKR